MKFFAKILQGERNAKFILAFPSRSVSKDYVVG